jgi:hypothetical protein
MTTRRREPMRFKAMLAIAAGVLAMAAACGGDGVEQPASASPTIQAPAVTSGGSVAPNVFMTFEGRRYQAQDVGSDLVSLDSIELAGTTDEIDIDHTAPVEVYRPKDATSDALYTFEPGRAFPEEEGGSTPDVWLEWAAVEGQAGEDVSSEPGSAGGGVPAEPGATPAQPEPTPSDQEAPPPGLGPTISPDDVVSATPFPGTDTTPGTTPDPSILAEEARAHLAQRLGVSVDAVEVVSVDEEWLPHPSCLNLQPGEACIQIAAQGYVVTLAVDGVEYTYYAYSEGQVYPAP